MRCDTCHKALPEAIDTWPLVLNYILMMEAQQRQMTDEIKETNRKMDYLIERLK